MKRIIVILSVIAAMSACTNIQQPTQPTLEENMRAWFDSIVKESNRNPNYGNKVVRTAKYVKTTYSSDSLCIINYSFMIEGKRHTLEYVFTYPISEYKERSKVHLWAHLIDSVTKDDRTGGVPIIEILDMNSDESIRMIRSMEDLTELR